MFGKRKTFLSIILILIIASLLSVLVVFDVLDTVKSANTTQSQINYVDNGGDHGKSLLFMVPVVDGYSDTFLEQFCDCEIKVFGHKNNSVPCTYVASSVEGDFLTWVGKDSATNSTHFTFFEIPGNRNLKQVLHLSCYHPEITNTPKFITLFLWLSLNEMIQIVSDPNPNNALHIFEELLDNHAFYVLGGGSLNLMLLNKAVFQRLGEEINFVNTYIHPHISQTSAVSKNSTEFVIAWEKSYFLLSKEVKIGNAAANIVVLSATILLTCERLLAFSIRTHKNRVGKIRGS